MHNYSYLKPSTRAHSSISHEHTPGSRTIFGVPASSYSPEEQEAVQRLREYLKHKHPTKVLDDSLLLRYCYMGAFRTAESVEKFRYYQQWENIPEISRQKSKGILHSGVFYCYGVDEYSSPTIYFHPSRINLQHYQISEYLAALKILLEPILDHMMVPGKIEHWNVVLDLRTFDAKKLSNNYEIIHNNLSKIVNAHPYRLKRLLVIEKVTSSLWGLSKSEASNPVQQIIRQLELDSKEVKISNMRQLDQYIPRSQREQEYGGDLENLREYWPILSTNKLMQENSRFIGDQSDSSSEYHSVQNKENEDYFIDRDPPPALCDLKRTCSLF